MICTLPAVLIVFGVMIVRTRYRDILQFEYSIVCHLSIVYQLPMDVSTNFRNHQYDKALI